MWWKERKERMIKREGEREGGGEREWWYDGKKVKKEWLRERERERERERDKKKKARDESDWWYVIGAIEVVSHTLGAWDQPLTRRWAPHVWGPPAYERQVSCV